MSGTTEGARRAAKTNKERNPLHYETIGRRGGVVKVPKGFALIDGETHQKLSRKGGAARHQTK